MKVLTYEDVRRPQLLTVPAGNLPTAPAAKVLLEIYTGILEVNHFAGHSATELDLLFPLVYIVLDSEKPKAINPFPDPDREPENRHTLKGAVCHVGIAGYVDKTDPGIDQILLARADLRGLRLKPSNKHIHVVVLQLRVKAQNYEFRDVGYQVSVLREGSISPLQFGGPDRDYGPISRIKQPGAPQRP